MATKADTQSPVNGAAIKQLRKSMGWKQKDLERIADVSLSTVQRAERGDATLKASTVRPIADALGVSLNTIYAVAEAPVRPTDNAPEWALAMESRIEERARRRHEELLAALQPLLDAAGTGITLIPARPSRPPQGSRADV